MKTLVILLLLCSIASPLIASPIINKFDEITYEDFVILPDPLAISFISEYCASKNVNIDNIRMASIDQFIKDYAERNGYKTKMVEILDKMIMVLGNRKL